MADPNQNVKKILRNLFLGKWAAAKLQLTNADADIYAHDLVKIGLNDESEIFLKIRKDFDKAGIGLSDQKILEEMTRLTVKTGEQFQTNRIDAESHAALKIVRTLKK